MLAILGYIFSIAVGISLGLIGGGGSILTVPILYYFFDTSAGLATAYSLFIVGVTSAIGAVGYHKRGLIDVKTGVIFALPAFLGVYATRLWVVPALPETIWETGDYTLGKDALIMGTFAVVMLLASVAMIRRKDAPDDGTPTPGAADGAVVKPTKIPLVATEGLIVGGVTGFVGAGGGFLIIPALVILAKIPMKTAVGTSLMIIAAKSLLGFTGDMTAGREIAWGFLSAVTALAVVGIFLGSWMSKKVPGKKLEPAFGWFVLVMGIFILLREVL